MEAYGHHLGPAVFLIATVALGQRGWSTSLLYPEIAKASDELVLTYSPIAVTITALRFIN